MGLVLDLRAILLDALPLALCYGIGTRLGGAWRGAALGVGPLLGSLLVLLGLPPVLCLLWWVVTLPPPQ